MKKEEKKEEENDIHNFRASFTYRFFMQFTCYSSPLSSILVKFLVCGITPHCRCCIVPYYRRIEISMVGFHQVFAKNKTRKLDLYHDIWCTHHTLCFIVIAYCFFRNFTQNIRTFLGMSVDRNTEKTRRISQMQIFFKYKYILPIKTNSLHTNGKKTDWRSLKSIKCM